MSDIPVSADAGECVELPGLTRKAGQFKPGTSGNRKGRPRMKADERSIIEKAMLDPVDITVNGRKTSVPYVSALFMTLKQQALKGSVKAAELLLSIARLTSLTWLTAPWSSSSGSKGRSAPSS